MRMQVLRTVAAHAVRSRGRISAAVAMVVALVAVIGDAGGSAAVGAHSGWRLVWSDEFSGPRGAAPDPAMWTVQTGGGGWGNQELQTYTTSAVALDGTGALGITARIGGTSRAPVYTSGRITSHGHGSFTYGLLEARIRLPEGQGLLPAFWLLGDDLYTAGWPAAGEIDVVETPNTTAASEHHVHAPSSAASGLASAGGRVLAPTRLSGGYHLYSVEKSPGTIVIRVDSRVVLTVTPKSLPRGGRWVFDKPFHALFSLAVGGVWPGPPDASTPKTSVMSIDWLRLYQH